MFDFIRTHQKLMQVILLIFVAPAFIFLGLSGYSFVSADPAMVEIGELTITKDEFTQAQRNQLQQMQESSQGRFDPAMLDNPAARKALMDQLINYKMQIALASENHFNVSDVSLRNAISNMPEFQEDGHFSVDRYNDFLASYGLTPRDFEASKRGELALDIVLQPIDQTAILPVSVLDSIKKALTEERTIRIKTFDATNYVDQVNVTDADIQAWYEANQDKLRLPQQVTIEYLVLDEQAARASVPTVDTVKLKEYYEQNKASYVIPGRVNASHILIKLPTGASAEDQQKALTKAQEIADKLQADTDKFAEIASIESQDAGTASAGGELGWVQRGSLPLDMEQALFALQQGEVSDPVKSPSGYHILKANQVQAEQGESFEDARAEVEQEVQRQLAAEKFADMATSLTSLVYDDPTSLEPAAKSLGLELRTATGIAREGLLDAAEVGDNAASASDDAAILDDIRVRQSLFSSQVINDRQNSGVIEISPDTLVTVRVQDVIAAHVPTIDLVSAKIKDILIQERSLADAIQAGKDYLTKLTNGDVEDITASDDGFTDQIQVSRLLNNGLSKTVVDAALEIKAENLPAYGSISLPDAFAIIEVQDIKAGTTDTPALASLGLQLSRVWGASEEQAYLDLLRQELGVTITAQGQELIANGDGSGD